MHIPKTYLCLAAIMILLHASALGCMCFPKSIWQQFSEAGYVFTGRCIMTDSLLVETEEYYQGDRLYRDMRMAVVLPDKQWKGLIPFDTAYIITGNGISDCGFGFQPDSSYLIFGNKWDADMASKTSSFKMDFFAFFKTRFNGFVFTNNCYGTCAKNQNAEASMNRIKHWYTF